LDSNCFRADSYNKNKLYFNLLHEKMQEIRWKLGMCIIWMKKASCLAQLDAARESFPDKVGRQKAQDRLFKMVQENGLLFWGVVVQMRVFWIQHQFTKALKDPIKLGKKDRSRRRLSFGWAYTLRVNKQ
jgi:hypothetical protein